MNFNSLWFPRIFRTTFLWLLGLFLVFSCERTRKIDYEFPFEGEKLVVYSTISNVRKPDMKVFLSVPFKNDSSTNYSPIQFPSAFLESEDGEQTAFVFSDGVGTAPVVIDPNKKYRVMVESNGMTAHSSFVSLPVFTPIDSSNYQVSLDSQKLDVWFYFNDQGQTEQYYTYVVESRKNGELLDSGRLNFKNCLSAEDAIDHQFVIHFKSELIRVFFDDHYNFWRDTINQVTVKLYSVSPSICEFYESLEILQLGDIYSDKKSLISNIEGGYGYFGGISVDSFVIHL